MKAVVYNKYGPPEVLEVKEVEKPVPKENEVLIKIHATTVTAVDSIFRTGNQPFARMATGVTKPKAPTLGSDLAGVIEAAGKEVKLFKEGDAVFGGTGSGSGAHAEYVCLAQDAPLAIKPADLTFEEAAAIPYGGLTALPFLRDTGKIKSSKKILINGASGAVGTSAVQLARNYGADITAVCGAANVELVKSLGADRVIDYSKEDFTRNGETWDLIFDTVGKSSFAQCKGSLSPGGTYMTTVLSLRILFQMLWTAKFSNKKAMIAFTGLRPGSEKAKDLAFIKGLIEAGKIKPVIDKRFPLEQIAEAHRYVDSGHKKGNVVINVVPDSQS